MSSSYLFFGLPSGLLNIGFHLYTFFLPFSLLAFDVNGQTNNVISLASMASKKHGMQKDTHFKMKIKKENCFLFRIIKISKIKLILF